MTLFPRAVNKSEVDRLFDILLIQLLFFDDISTNAEPKQRKYYRHLLPIIFLHFLL